MYTRIDYILFQSVKQFLTKEAQNCEYHFFKTSYITIGIKGYGLLFLRITKDSVVDKSLKTKCCYCDE